MKQHALSFYLISQNHQAVPPQGISSGKHVLCAVLKHHVNRLNSVPDAQTESIA